MAPKPATPEIQEAEEPGNLAEPGAHAATEGEGRAGASGWGEGSGSWMAWGKQLLSDAHQVGAHAGTACLPAPAPLRATSRSSVLAVDAFGVECRADHASCTALQALPASLRDMEPQQLAVGALAGGALAFAVYAERRQLCGYGCPRQIAVSTLPIEVSSDLPAHAVRAGV